MKRANRLLSSIKKEKRMRRRLEERRAAETYAFEYNGQKYTATVSRFSDGGMAELFLHSSRRRSTEQDNYVRDAAIAVSLALQHGCPLATLRSSMGSGPVSLALEVAEEEEKASIGCGKSVTEPWDNNNNS